MPVKLQRFGLESATKTFLENINKLGHLDIFLRTNLGETRFDSEIEINLYRIICELINNTIRHSGAKNARLNLDLCDGFLLLTYYDDGKGYDVDSLSEQGSGLLNIKNRVNSMNAETEILYSAGKCDYPYQDKD